jgi:threonyl-tRNA synthetase
MWRQLHESSGYQFVYTPHVARRELWEVSGHTQHYLDNMFALQEIDGQEYFLKPMNCPFHMQIFGSRRHSYRELPIRYAELGTVYRFERSGVMHGLARVRGFTQDDAHIFCRPQQLVSEICGVIDLIDRIYRTFELEYTAELSTRPENSIGSDQAWQDAEAGLRQALNEKGLAYEVNEGDGAFYGPKIDFKLRDALGRWWQGATIQLDFNLPERFQLAYTGADGQMHRPVMLHRAIFGSLERFTGLLIEHYGGAFPVWLCQTQVAILPIADRHLDYCYAIRGELVDAGLRGSVDPRAEKVNAKIRDAQLEQIPFMLVIGDREMEAGKVSVRERRQGDLGSMSGQEFVRLAQEANLTDSVCGQLGI